MNLNTEQLTIYLQQMAKLEQSLYVQREVKDGALKIIKEHDPQNKTEIFPENPKKPTAYTYDSNDIFSDIKRENDGCFKGIIWTACGGFLGLIWSIYLIANSYYRHGLKWDYVQKDLQHGFGIFVLICAIGLLIASLCLGKKFYDLWQTEKNLREAKVSAYKGEKKEFDRKMQIYNQKVILYNQRKAEKEKKHQLFVQACKKIEATLDNAISRTNGLLENGYEYYNVLFESYRCRPAVVRMRDYFLSGRCTELTGASGAYNLYENERRLEDLISVTQQAKWDNTERVLIDIIEYKKEKMVNSFADKELSEEEVIENNVTLKEYCAEINAELDAVEAALGNL